MSQSQAVPELLRRRQGRRPAAAPRHGGVTDLNERRTRLRRKPPSPKRRPPLLPFVLGVAFGYSLASPLPKLLPAPANLASIIHPFGLGDRRVLVLGTDKVGSNTDVMLAVGVNNGTTNILQVPRDTFVESPQFGVVKANALYAFGGIGAVKQEVSQLIHAPVHRHVRINLQAVQRLADAVGGVEVDVPKRLYYVDNSQNLYIDLYPGRQVLKGEALEGFLRFRHDALGDLGRMERQKLVLAEVFRKLANPTTLAKLPVLLKLAGDDIETDLNPLELAQLITAMASTKLNTDQLPGRVFWHDDLSYWMPDTNQHYAGVESTEPTL
jgi:LCP family protein required for cell wall assembly